MTKLTVILGISAFYHDSAAALIIDGEIIAAAQEERFTRVKNDASFPKNAISYVLAEARLQLEDITEVAFYDKPFLKFERLLETYHAVAPAGLQSFLKAIPVWIKDKLFMKRLIRKELSALGKLAAPILFTEHHLSHAASAFYPSPFQEAAILTIDGVGEWTTTSLGKGSGNSIEILKELHFPHSLGLLYSAFTFYLGFKVNSGEYKMMGLAPYGHPKSKQTLLFIQKIKEKLLDIRPNGSFLLNMAYFRFASDLQMTHDQKWQGLFNIPRRQPESEINQTHMNLALAIQIVTEEVILLLAKTMKQITGSKNLVMAGGVALNCVANARIVEAKLFEEVWVQPAAGDAGGALGAALAVYYLNQPEKTRVSQKPDAMQGAYLGPVYSDKQIARALLKFNIKAEVIESRDLLLKKTAQNLKSGKVVGWFQGRMEFGPRALGNRSILADASNSQMQQRLNEKIKLREGFRPFAPSVRVEDVTRYFEWEGLSPYMLLVAPVKNNIRTPEPPEYHTLPLYNRLSHPRSSIPAVTHLNYTARLQTVTQTTNPLFYDLLTEFFILTGTGVLVNTSFNVRGEPIVCTPEDALRCYLKTDMDCLVLGNYILEKN
ncbi:carbamoyltransferase family protein [Adhaeribacter radiodurans]|uniref:Carbamoyltransferase n=1 Tax=Adhaeribacter radiodurans TaxID=2745197 RepID=A0A7L7L8I8_9BACT|nr:carbamoyltransferase [Adhaeribacter radiodurans]QMU29053.1 carbamoyltransferase [Adhaeribacter radiodurans]